MKTNEDFDPIWQRYQQFDGSSLPFDEHAFDVVIFSDVLHHVPAGLVSPLLKSAARVGIQVAVCRNLLLGFTQLMVLLPRPFISLLFLVLVFSFFADRHR
jgi:ubiquinone/menaquinone biosynthesis C-methylase UbiE